MKPGLARVLRLRALLEDLSAVELGRRTREIRRLESEAEQQKQQALEARSEALRLLASGKDWMTDSIDAEILRWSGGRFAALARASRPKLEAARDEFLARRIERRQIETLVRDELRATQTEQTRREQKRLDDWFQSRSSQRSR